MDMTNLIIYVMIAVFLLSSRSLSEAESSSVEADRTTVTTTTLSWVPSPTLSPHNDSHGVSTDEAKETDAAAADDDAAGDDDDLDDDSHTTGGGSYDELYPNPREDPNICHLGDNPAWLCNKNDALKAEAANELNKLLESLAEASETCPCQDFSCEHTGLPMVVVVLDTIPDYQNKSHKDKEEHVHGLALSFLSGWFSNKCANGAVTVVVAKEGIVETVIGQASRYLVSDDCQELVENATSSFFEAGHIEEGLTKLIQQYRLIVLKNHSCSSDSHLRRSIVIPIILVIVLIIVAAIAAAVLLIYRRRGSKDIRTEADIPLKDQQQTEKA